MKQRRERRTATDKQAGISRKLNRDKRKWALLLDETKEWLYRCCYIVGIRTIRSVRSIGRITANIWHPLVHSCYRLLDSLLLRHVRTLREGGHRVLADVRSALYRFSERQEKRSLRLLPQMIGTATKTLRSHRTVIRSALNLAAPGLAVLLLIFTLSFWNHADFALSLEYGGERIGYIESEDTYKSAASMVEDMVINADNSFRIETAPKMNLAVVRKDAMLTDVDIRDHILNSVNDTIVQSAGLFVDGAFQGALNTSQQLQAIMNEILAPHVVEGVDDAAFVADVRVVEGLYPVTSLVSDATIRTYLNALQVKTLTNITYTTPLKYKTITEEVSTQPMGYVAIRRRGVDGTQKVTAQIVTIDGKEISRNVIAAETIKAPIDMLVEVGNQKYDTGAEQGDGVAQGNFIWPLPYTKQISSPFASRWGSFHGAIDIANGSTFGKPIIASDGGVVLEAEYHSSYGYYVLIDHGNGFKTRYAHCSSLNVKAGQKVAQGEFIAKVGNTGYSFGAHLHFEVIKDGKLVDPLHYVKR